MTTLLRPKLSTQTRTARYKGGFVIVTIDGVVELKFPVSANPRLAQGNEVQLGNIQISPYGLHWPDLDEDLSFEGLLNGDCG